MKKTKEFDCVEMKRRIQAEMLIENEGLTAAEQRERRRKWLETSPDPLAVQWRRLTAEGGGRPRGPLRGMIPPPPSADRPPAIRHSNLDTADLTALSSARFGIGGGAGETLLDLPPLLRKDGRSARVDGRQAIRAERERITPGGGPPP